MAKREYVEANKRWLEEKAKEEGVMALSRGIYYKLIGGIKIRLKISIFYGEKVVHLADF